MGKVSLIVPVYRAEPWIDECMASIRAQTYKDIELIVEDDSQASGAAAARNRGLDKATGEFIAFCDADDYLAPDAIEKLVGAMDGVDMVCGSFRKFGDFEMTVTHETSILDMWQVAMYAMSNLKDPRRNQLLSGCWAKLYRRDVVGRFPQLTTAEDVAFNFACFSRCNAVRFISDIVYNNRRHGGSLTTTFDENDRSGLFGFFGGLKFVRRFLLQAYPDEEIGDAMDNYKAYHSALYAMRISGLSPQVIKETFRKIYGN